MLTMVAYQSYQVYFYRLQSIYAIPQVRLVSPDEKTQFSQCLWISKEWLEKIRKRCFTLPADSQFKVTKF